MTELFTQLRQNITNSHSIDSQELKEYALFICEQIPNIKQSHQHNIISQLQTWLEMVANSIKTTLNSKQTNQIGPRLELIYTTVINQQQTVNQHIKDIADLILKQNYCFVSQTETKDKKIAMKYTQTSQSGKKQEFICKNSDSFYNSAEKTVLKGRSLSNGSQRRKLSKVSCFAEAKKIEKQNDNYLQTQTLAQGFFKQGTGQKIKKTKKKEDNGFAYLQKCMSSTSPSHFMLGYMAKADYRNMDKPEYRKEHRQSRDRSRSSSRIEQKYNQSIVITDTVVQKERNQLAVPLASQNHCSNDSGTYQKMMVSFQQKIGQKLDELMNKYSQIQQKLQQKQQQVHSKQIKSEPQYSIAVHVPPQIKQNSPKQQYPKHQYPIQKNDDSNNSSSSDTISAVQNKITFMERQAKKVSKQKQNDKECSQVKPATNNANKSIVLKNKIVRNKVEQTAAEEESMESITLPKNSLKSLNLHETKNKQPIMLSLNNIQTLQSKTVSKAQLEIASQQIKAIVDDHNYIVKQIAEFNKTTLKVILPISKKLLFIIKNKYQTFCKKHNLELKAQIKDIITQQVKSEQAELKDSLQKMQKILQLNCNEQKKQKLLLYVSSFLQCYLSFSDQNAVVRLPNEVISEQSARSKIKQAISKLNK